MHYTHRLLSPRTVSPEADARQVVINMDKTRFLPLSSSMSNHETTFRSNTKKVVVWLKSHHTVQQCTVQHIKGYYTLQKDSLLYSADRVY